MFPTDRRRCRCRAAPSLSPHPLVLAPPPAHPPTPPFPTVKGEGGETFDIPICVHDQDSGRIPCFTEMGDTSLFHIDATSQLEKRGRIYDSSPLPKDFK